MRTPCIISLYTLLQVSCLLAHAAIPQGEVVWWGSTQCAPAVDQDASGYSTGVVAIAGVPLTNAVALAACDFHCLALRSDGSVVGWGANQLGQATGTAMPEPCHTNGAVVLGSHPLTNVVALGAANSASVALTADGVPVAWGNTKDGLTDIPPGVTNVVAIAVAEAHCLGLKRDGSVVSWGKRHSLPEGLTNVVAIAAGCRWFSEAMALKRGGTVIAWDSVGRLISVPSDASNVVAIAAGAGHLLALRTDGRVVGWGSNRQGEATGTPTDAEPFFSSGLVRLGGQPLTNVAAISAGPSYSLALRRDGTVVCWGDHRYYRDVPAGLAGVVQVLAGPVLCLAITTNTNWAPPKK